MRWQVLNDHLASVLIDAHMDDSGQAIDRFGHMPHARAARDFGHSQGRCLDLVLGRWLLRHARSTQSLDGHYSADPQRPVFPRLRAGWENFDTPSAKFRRHMSTYAQDGHKTGHFSLGVRDYERRESCPYLGEVPCSAQLSSPSC
jgi:hypothetical protein